MSFLNWKRIQIADEVFEKELSPFEPKVTKSNLEKIDSKMNRSDWLWEFPENLNGFLRQKPLEAYAVKDGANYRSVVDINKGESVSENLFFEIAPNTQSTFFFDYSSKENVNLFSNIDFKVGEYAKVRIIRIQRISGDSICIFQNHLDIDERAEVDFVDLQLGADKKVVNVEAHLTGFQSHYEIHPLYFCDVNTSSDLSYTSYHRAKKSVSNILSKGILKKDSKKVFRGNLHFEKGATKSQGREEEFCYYFDNVAKSDSFPALMCDEDDVIGEHAASIGRFSQRQLFYLMSRGFSENEAKILLASAIFEDVISSRASEEDLKMVTKEIERLVGVL